MLSNLFSLVLLALPLATLALHGNAHLNRHHDVAKRGPGHVQLHKRYSNTRWTFYDAGLSVDQRPLFLSQLTESTGFVGVLVVNGILAGTS